MQPPERQEFTFTREQFYETLWTNPTTKIAKELGCSDVLIGKVCKAFDIPKPYLGYWAKLEYGKKPKKTPLPSNLDPNAQSLTFYKYPQQEALVSQPQPEPEYDPDIRQMLDKALSLGPIKIPDSLRNPHPLVAATRDRFKLSQVPYYRPQTHWQAPDSRPTLAFEVSAETSSRAFRIMDAMIKRIEAIGGKVEVKRDKSNRWMVQTVISFGGVDVSVIRLREKYNQIRIPPEKRQDVWSPKVEMKPTGMLVLDTGSGFASTVLLHDTPKHHRMEEGLHSLILGFVRSAGGSRNYERTAEIKRKAHEEEERLRRLKEEELRRQREELAERQKAERDRVDELIRHVNSWKKSQDIREYLEAMCEMLLKRDGAIPTEGEAADYLRWANQQAVVQHVFCNYRSSRSL